MHICRLGTLHNTRLLLQQYNGPSKPLTPFQHGLAGLAGGITVSFVATPIEQIKARLQVQYADGKKIYKGPIHCAKMLVCLLSEIFCRVIFGTGADSASFF